MGTADIENAQGTLKNNLEKSDSLVMTQAEFDKANRLLEDYGSLRDDLQEKMVSLLGQVRPFEPGSGLGRLLQQGQRLHWQPQQLDARKRTRRCGAERSFTAAN